MEEENSDGTLLKGSPSIYEKGHPFYKLSNREARPSMNLLNIFNIHNPNVTDFYIDARKNYWSQQCIEAFTIMLQDVELFAKNKDFSNCKVASIFEIFYSCLKYLTKLPALAKEDFLHYFRETLLLYCVQDPPDCLRIFNAIEGFEIAKLFHELMGTNFEMIKHVLLPVYIIQIDVE